jgi:hypothetical protein
LLSQVVLQELNGSRENAQQFGRCALCVAGGGQFAPQQFAATVSACPPPASARDPSGRTIVNARTKTESLRNPRRIILNDSRHCKEHCRDWNVLRVIMDCMIKAGNERKRIGVLAPFLSADAQEMGSRSN